jgi:hypothetical protein
MVDYKGTIDILTYESWIRTEIGFSRALAL